MDLGGVWRAHVADDELRRIFATPEHRTTDADNVYGTDWHDINVPGHWRTNDAFKDNDQPLLYRRRFEADAPTEDRRAWLGFEGLFYQGDVWLDGLYLGDTEGYFVPHTFEVTDALKQQREHLLGVEVTCAPQRTRTAKRNLTGVFQHWDCIDPEWNPGGIWRPVTLFETGAVRIVRLRIICLEANRERAVLSLRAVLDSKEARSVRIRTGVSGTLDEQEHNIASGQNRVEWKVVVERPQLWWPHALGTPDLTEIMVQIIDPDTDMVSDSRRRRTGLRQVRRDDWVFEINGERLYLKGANVGPARMAIGDATSAELRHDIELARDAGLDLLRVHAHVTHPQFYDIADEVGMLVWQDMPLQWGYSKSVRKQAVKQAGEIVDLLGHHPSIIHWCGHNEPLALDVNPEAMAGSPKKAADMIGRYIALQELPTWNKSVLDFSIHRALTRADPSRPVTAHSGILPGPTSGGTDSHFYFGWYHGHERDLPRLLRSFPRVARFISEFGAQAIPNSDAFMDSARWPALDWDRLGHDHGLQKTFFDRNVAPADYVSYEDWKRATQEHQATVLRRHIEELRRIKYRPGGGFCMFSLADSRDHPAVTWAVLDNERQPKAGFEAMVEACRPLIVTCDRPPAVVSVHDAVSLDVHVVSDVRHVLRAALLTAVVRWPGGSHRWEWTGDIAPDAVTRIGAIDLVVPSPAHPAALPLRRSDESPEASFVVDLTLNHPEATATNRYVSAFV